MLLNGFETWQVRTEDMQVLSLLEHRCLYSIGRAWFENVVRNSAVGHRNLGSRVQFLEAANLNK